MRKELQRAGALWPRISKPYRSQAARLQHTEAAAAEWPQLPICSGMDEVEADVVLAALDRVYRRSQCRFI